jgi:hypothetical protein
MHYEGIEYVVRGSIGRDQWTLLIYFPNNPDGKATAANFSGTRDEANGSARRRIDSWLKRQRKKLAGESAV